MLPNVGRSPTRTMSLSTYLLTGAKRIGLLFSGASVDFNLDPQKTLDIPDMTVGEEVFSDGCGLMAKHLAIHVAKLKAIKFRNKRYTPTVFQIRCSVSSYDLPGCSRSRLKVPRVQGGLDDPP